MEVVTFTVPSAPYISAVRLLVSCVGRGLHAMAAGSLHGPDATPSIIWHVVETQGSHRLEGSGVMIIESRQVAGNVIRVFDFCAVWSRASPSCCFVCFLLTSRILQAMSWIFVI